MLTGDLGQSFYYKTEVTALIGQRLEPTLSLAAVTITIAVLVAVPLGVLAAWRFGGWLDRALMAFSVLGFSVPVFVLAYLLIWLVSLKLGWLPVQGYQRLADGPGTWSSICPTTSTRDRTTGATTRPVGVGAVSPCSTVVRVIGGGARADDRCGGG